MIKFNHSIYSFICNTISYCQIDPQIYSTHTSPHAKQYERCDISRDPIEQETCVLKISTSRILGIDGIEQLSLFDRDVEPERQIQDS